MSTIIVFKKAVCLSRRCDAVGFRFLFVRVS
uniref:Uncharacterized protein n=1 Tax=Anguilla anguilla TaxID=7936 RepID=A0A0E9R3P2_ANGAN